MEILLAGDRIGAIAHARRQPAVRRPNRRRRRGQLIALVDVGRARVCSRLSRPCEQILQQAEGVFRRAEPRRHRGERGARGGAAHRAVLHDGGQLVHRVLQRRVERRLRAEVRHRGLQRHDLAGELSRSRRGSWRSRARAWHATRRGCATSYLAFSAAPVPIRIGSVTTVTTVNEHRLHADREAADHAGGAVGQNDRVALGKHQVPELIGNLPRFAESPKG